MTRCTKCGGSSLAQSNVDRRILSICRTCCDFTYEPRTKTMGFEMILDEIAEGVADRGHHETPTVILINTAFRSGDDRDPHAQLQEWAAKHMIRFERQGEMTIFERDGTSLSQCIDRTRAAEGMSSE